MESGWLFDNDGYYYDFETGYTYDAEQNDLFDPATGKHFDMVTKAEIGAAGGNLCLTLQQRFREDTVRETFLRQLDEYGIPYHVIRRTPCDNAAFPEPELF